MANHPCRACGTVLWFWSLPDGCNRCMTEFRACGCIVPDDGPRIWCGQHRTPDPPAKVYTHIRGEGFIALCGLERPGSSIGRDHYAQRHTSPAIAGQIARIPEPLCPRCVETAG